MILSATVAAAAQAQPTDGEGILRFDSDGDGRVSQEEFVPGDKRRGPGGLASADADGDGAISRMELQGAMNEAPEKRQARMAAAFDDLDDDGNGVVTRDEITAGVFSRVDSDGDGYITTEEAQAAQAGRRGKRKQRSGEDGY
jgi:Ca2+-binding EF-hand superfamily protein